MPEPFDTGIKRTALLIKQKPPSVSWLIMILSSLDPNHEVFAKDYVRPKEEKQQYSSQMVYNPEGFFDGLPVAKKKGKGKFCLT